MPKIPGLEKTDKRIVAHVTDPLLKQIIDKTKELGLGSVSEFLRFCVVFFLNYHNRED